MGAVATPNTPLPLPLVILVMLILLAFGIGLIGDYEIFFFLDELANQ